MQAESSAGPSGSSSSSSNGAGHAADAALTHFARGVVALLTVWPALRLALSHGWDKKPKPSSSSGDVASEFPPETPLERRTRLAEELVDAYYSAYTEKNGQLPEITDIEDFLLDFIEYEYGIALEDGSEVSLAKDLQNMWIECVKRANGQLVLQHDQEGIVEKFERMARKANEEDRDPNKAFRATRCKINAEDDEDDDSDSSDDEGGHHNRGGMDVVMEDEEAPQLVDAGHAREKPEPIVDEDGFTMVTKKGKR